MSQPIPREAEDIMVYIRGHYAFRPLLCTIIDFAGVYWLPKGIKSWAMKTAVTWFN